MKIKEAAKLKKEYPWLTHKRALELAKKFLEEEKSPQDGNPKGTKK